MHELRRTESCRDSDVSRVTAAPDQDPTYPGMIVPRVESVPPSAEKHLEPGAEIHRSRVSRHTDVSEIAGAVASRNIHAAAQRHSKMSEIAAHADTFLMTFGSRAVATRMVIAERDPVMHIVANRLHALPAARNASKQLPGKVA